MRESRDLDSGRRSQVSGLRFQYTPCHSERSEESAFLAVETGLAPSPSRVSTQSSYCTVSVTATCFVIGDAPDDVAVTVTVLEPSGVPTVGGLPPPLGGLAAVPQPVDQIVDSVSKQIRPKRRMLPVIRFPFLLTNTMPMKPGNKNA